MAGTARPHTPPRRGLSLSRDRVDTGAVGSGDSLRGSDQLDDVLRGIDAALDAGLAPVKLNVVVLRGVNDDEVVDLARYGRDRGVTVRFIEWMPLDGGDAWTNEQVVTQAEILEQIHAVFPVEPIARGTEPAERFRYRDGQGEVGVIPSVTRPFCEQCDRIRLTADGQLRSCLFSLEDHDLRGLLCDRSDFRHSNIDGQLISRGRTGRINWLFSLRKIPLDDDNAVDSGHGLVQQRAGLKDQRRLVIGQLCANLGCLVGRLLIGIRWLAF